jgi:hypothetical protein
MISARMTVVTVGLPVYIGALIRQIFHVVTDESIIAKSAMMMADRRDLYRNVELDRSGISHEHKVLSFLEVLKREHLEKTLTQLAGLESENVCTECSTRRAIHVTQSLQRRGDFVSPRMSHQLCPPRYCIGRLSYVCQALGQLYSLYLQALAIVFSVRYIACTLTAAV